MPGFLHPEGGPPGTPTVGATRSVDDDFPVSSGHPGGHPRRAPGPAYRPRDGRGPRQIPVNSVRLALDRIVVMAEQTSDLEAAVLAAQEAVARQGDVVRSLKADAKDGKADKVGFGRDVPCNMPHRVATLSGRVWRGVRGRFPRGDGGVRGKAKPRSEAFARVLLPRRMWRLPSRS